ncbi:tetratricopeptide repeat protein [Sulfurirhabdus autotrophica]|uniref:protein O-GlcNAc transferase n=1 Tax=Sulfurirhabdus autotrophica TaxID=1706046 RepID=A0A4R3YG23_9PROT|nr:tetratricopeptide repeat protein [Sulfurirhabdus autotrophica]TCV90158.1 putative O-linked N-acetylglucosamine transferase (SPINDLY family) [Sulfurirhabdus autotrophica]
MKPHSNTAESTQHITTTIDRTLQQAVALHQAGQLQAAEQLYSKILLVQPNHSEAHHNMGVLAMQMKKPDAVLPHFMAALEANPTHGPYWLSYIDALIKTGQLDAAREVLALARQQGIGGGEINALAIKLSDSATTITPSTIEYKHAYKEPQPTSLSASNKIKNKPLKSGKSTKKSATHNKKAPAPQDVNSLVSLFTEGHFTKAASVAQAMTVRYPLHGFGWKALGAAFNLLGQNTNALAPMQKAAMLLPYDADAHSNLGITLHELNRLDEAEASCRRALEINPELVAAHITLSFTLHELNRFDEAEMCCRKALEINPEYAEAYNNLGNALKAQGRLDEAEASYRRALNIKPDFAEAHSNLAVILHELGRLDEAETSCIVALRIKPVYAEAHSNLGVILHELGRLNEAEASYRRALEIKPDYAEANCNLGATLFNLERLDEAQSCYQRALDINPELADAHYNLGNTLKSQGELQKAEICYQMAHQKGLYGARIRKALLLPSIMGTKPELFRSRAKFEQNLDKLIEENVPINEPLKIIGETNFYLAYHGLNDRDLQVKIAKYYEKVSPSLLFIAPHCSKSKLVASKKIRVGFFSKFLYSHSVSLCFSKIIESLSLKPQLEVTLISNSSIDDNIYANFAGNRVRIPYNLPGARKIIADLELDIMVYLDIGMEPLSYFMAFSRLARVQCVLTGHPVTTGIANIDYFLSTDRMEPNNAEEHYSEKLVRFPSPIVYFSRPSLPAILKTRLELDLPNDQHIYMCPMKLQKLHPDFDEAITRILQLDENGVIILFEDDLRPYWKHDVIKRFQNTIPEHLRVRIIFLPWLSNPIDFMSAISAADVILDPFHFGIGSTAAMTSITGTPLVTKVGEFMRGRVGAYYCEMLDLSDCVTKDTENYAKKAVQIASDQQLRDKISKNILKNNSVLYENLQPVDDLIDFFNSVMSDKHSV